MKERKSSSGLLRNVLLITTILNFFFTHSHAIAAEKMPNLVQIQLPKPAPGFKLGPFDCSDKWIVWTEFKQLNSRSRVPRYVIKVFRGKVGENEREKLLDFPPWSSRPFPLVFITNKGMVLIAEIYHSEQGKSLLLIWPNGKRRILKPTLDLRPFELSSDGLIAGVEQKSGRGKLVFCKITKQSTLASPIVLEENFVNDGSVFDYHYCKTCRKVISRCGTKVAWINGHPRMEPDIVVADFETGERKIVGKGMKLPYPYPLEMDGLYGKWLLCHQGTIARLINIDDTSELQLPLPGQVKFICPYGILFQIADNHHRFWDPILQKRWDFLCDPQTTFLSRFDRTKPGTRIYIFEPYREVFQRRKEPGKPLERPRVRYFTTKDQMVHVPPELLAEAATATRACKKAYELDKDGSEWHRIWRAMWSIEWPYPPDTIPLMEILLNSYREPNVRSTAAQTIAFSNDPAAKQILFKALKKKKDWSIRESILVYLGFLCDKEDAIHIIEQQSPRGPIEQAAGTLGILGNPAALEYLQKATDVKFPMKEQQDKVRASVRNAIRYIKMRSEIETVLKTLRTASRD